MADKNSCLGHFTLPIIVFGLLGKLAEDSRRGNTVSRSICSQACIDEQQQYLAYTSLLRHTVAANPLLQHKQASVARTACQEGLRLPAVLRSAAFVAAVKVYLQCPVTLKYHKVFTDCLQTCCPAQSTVITGPLEIRENEKPVRTTLQTLWSAGMGSCNRR